MPIMMSVSMITRHDQPISVWRYAESTIEVQHDLLAPDEIKESAQGQALREDSIEEMEPDLTDVSEETEREGSTEESEPDWGNLTFAQRLKLAHFAAADLKEVEAEMLEYLSKVPMAREPLELRFAPGTYKNLDHDMAMYELQSKICEWRGRGGYENEYGQWQRPNANADFRAAEAMRLRHVDDTLD